MLSHVQLFCDPMDATCQGPLVMEFSRKEYWSVLPFPFPGDLPDSGIEPGYSLPLPSRKPNELLINVSYSSDHCSNGNMRCLILE